MLIFITILLMLFVFYKLIKLTTTAIDKRCKSRLTDRLFDFFCILYFATILIFLFL
jgi:nitrogen fixation/metabolism regulation signal transduction histidine kinase